MNKLQLNRETLKNLDVTVEVAGGASINNGYCPGTYGECASYRTNCGIPASKTCSSPCYSQKGDWYC